VSHHSLRKLIIFSLFFKGVGNAQPSKSITTCISSSVTTNYITISLASVEHNSSIPIFSKTFSKKDSCLTFTTNSSGTYRLIIQSDCCPAIIKQWNAEDVPNNHRFDFTLKERLIKLREIEVKAIRQRIRQSGDTLFINTEDVVTRPHADATALFDKIPGLQIGVGGNVSIMGKSVRSVTIDGKQIFGGVASLTLSNLRADMIKEMEFVEKQLPGGQTYSQLNLRLKENRKNGIYGDVAAGYGTGNNWLGKAAANKINGKGFFNAFLTSNTINERGIDGKTIERLNYAAMKNALNASGSVIGLYDNTSNEIKLDLDDRIALSPLAGLNRFTSGGINITRTFSPKVEIDGFLFFDNSRQNISQSKEVNQFLGDLTQRTENSTLQRNVLNKLTGNVNAKIQLSEKLEWRVSDQFGFGNNATNFSDSLRTNLQPIGLNNAFFATQNTAQNETNHRLQSTLIRKGNKGGKVTSLVYELTQNFNPINKEFTNEGSTSFATFSQSQRLEKDLRQNNHYFQLNQSIPLSRRFLIEGKAKQLIENKQFYQSTILLDKSNALIQDSLSMTNYVSEIGAYLLYQRPRFKAIGSGAFTSFSSQRNQDGTSIKINQNFLFTPFTKLEFKLRKSTLSARYGRNILLPDWQQVILPIDSSNLSNLIIGNLLLKPYKEDRLDISSSFSSKKGLQVIVTFSHSRFLDFIVNDNSFQPLLNSFSTSYANVTEPTSNTGLNVSVFKIGLNSKFTWFALGGINQLKSFVKTEDNLTPFSTLFSFYTLSGNWKATPKINTKFDLQGQVSFLNNQVTALNIWKLKTEWELGKDFYLDAQLRSIIGKPAEGSLNFQPFVDAEISKYLFKNKGVQASLLMKNIFNLKNERAFGQSANFVSVTSTNFLPRLLMLKATVYPESWK
jgi:hypothetical protein